MIKNNKIMRSHMTYKTKGLIGIMILTHDKNMVNNNLEYNPSKINFSTGY